MLNGDPMRSQDATLWMAAILLTGASIAPLSSAGDDPLTSVPIERFHKVDERLYRGSQPAAEGFRHLRDLGVRTVINFRLESDAIETGERILIVDDLIATGGTAEAAVKLVRRSGGQVVGATFIIDLPELGGMRKLAGLGVSCHALMTFEGH